ncbi:glycosyltransferase family 4 protein [Synechococcus sp. MIT S9508]|uniref:glycosyltransferase family 4 protein n=1 Tax=Synechococcus sp. MIT S9508 TaxID=1801629 RepID=UPI00082ED42D|nr:glycosyltransferase family 4 protein [Synechococcus sp. MIT S9508]
MTKRGRRLLLVSEHFQPRTSATAQLMTDLANDLVGFGWRVTVVTATPDQETPSPSKATEVVRLKKTHTKQSRNGVFSKALRGVHFLISSLTWCLVRGRQGDVILIVSNPPFIGLLGPLLRTLKGLPYVFLFQDLFPQTAVISGLLPPSSPVTNTLRWLMSLVCRNSASTIVLSDAMRQQLIRDLGQRTPIAVIHNWAVEQAHALPRSVNPFAAEHGFQDCFTVQYSGNFGRLHDLKTLLDTASILIKHPVQFVFIGGGAKQSQIDASCEINALTNILRLPYQPRGKLPYSLGACDLAAISLMPGAENSMAPCKFYGILASGRGVVVVARRNCDLAQIVLNAGIGVVVEPGESAALAEELLQLSKQPERVKAMGDRARSLYTERFGRERSVMAYAHLLEQLQ